MIKRKNPSFIKHGYHITPIENLKNILTNGLVRKSNYDSVDYKKIQFGKYLYGSKSPLWFYTNTDFDKFSSWSKSYFYKFKKSDSDLMLIKFNISSFNQYPDIEPLLYEKDLFFNVYTHKIGWSDYLNKYVNYNEPVLIWTDLDRKIPKIFYKHIEDYQNAIPVSSLKNNKLLIFDIIKFTNTLCIIENISSDYIEGYRELDWKEFYGNKKYEWLY